MPWSECRMCQKVSFQLVWEKIREGFVGEGDSCKGRNVRKWALICLLYNPQLFLESLSDWYVVTSVRDVPWFNHSTQGLRLRHKIPKLHALGEEKPCHFHHVVLLTSFSHTRDYLSVSYSHREEKTIKYCPVISSSLPPKLLSGLSPTNVVEGLHSWLRSQCLLTLLACHCCSH